MYILDKIIIHLSVCAVIRRRSPGSTSSVAAKVSASTSWRRLPSQSNLRMTFTWSLMENTARKSMERGTAWWERWGHRVDLCLTVCLSFIFLQPSLSCLLTVLYSDFPQTMFSRCKCARFCKWTVCVSQSHACVNHRAVSFEICLANLTKEGGTSFTLCLYHSWCYCCVKGAWCYECAQLECWHTLKEDAGIFGIVSEKAKGMPVKCLRSEQKCKYK